MRHPGRWMAAAPVVLLLALSACGSVAPATDEAPVAATVPKLSATDLAMTPAAIALTVSASDVPTGPSAAPPTDTSVPAPSAAEEWPLTTIPLAGSAAGPVAGPNAEYSGLAWYGDWLILLPQYPGRFAAGSDGAVLALRRADLLAYLDGTTAGPLEPRVVPFAAPGLAAAVPGFEGYEALAFHGDGAFLTIEASPASGMRGYLVSGRCAPDLSELVLDRGTLVGIPVPAQSSNKSFESLLLADGQVLAIYEANGADLATDPVAERFDLALVSAGSLSYPQVEYRITDVTALDGEGRFWAINYFFLGEPELKPAVEPLAERYGRGPPHAQAEYVERLLEFELAESAIRLVERPPLQLSLLPDEAGNWEGIVRLDGRGFLLVTDKFPETILAFVPSP